MVIKMQYESLIMHKLCMIRPTLYTPRRGPLLAKHLLVNQLYRIHLFLADGRKQNKIKHWFERRP